MGQDAHANFLKFFKRKESSYEPGKKYGLSGLSG